MNVVAENGVEWGEMAWISSEWAEPKLNPFVLLPLWPMITDSANGQINLRRTQVNSDFLRYVAEYIII